MTRNKEDKRSRLPEGDDGHTIANMNVEGMPWYQPERPGWFQRSVKQTADDGLDRRQMRTFTLGALKAALLVTLAMCLGIVMFVAFCVFVWFR